MLISRCTRIGAVRRIARTQHFQVHRALIGWQRVYATHSRGPLGNRINTSGNSSHGNGHSSSNSRRSRSDNPKQPTTTHTTTTTKPQSKIPLSLLLLCTSLLFYHHRPIWETGGPSMLPTIPLHAYVICLPWLNRYGRGVVVGDVVAAHSPYEAGFLVMKRVLGVQGDVVCVLPCEDGWSTVSAEDAPGEAQLEAVGDERRGSRYITIPRGHVWIEGDNAPWSVDSRHYGPVPMGLVIGKVVAVCEQGKWWRWRWIEGEGMEELSPEEVREEEMDWHVREGG